MKLQGRVQKGENEGDRRRQLRGRAVIIAAEAVSIDVDDGVESVDDARDVAQQGQKQADAELNSAATMFEPNAEGREKDSD